MGDATVDAVETAKEVELEVKPEEGTELPQSHDKTPRDEELFLWMSKESGALK